MFMRKKLAIFLIFWANSALAYVKFEPVVKLFNDDPALDISYQNFDRRQGDVDVDEIQRDYTCRVFSKGSSQAIDAQEIGFAAKGFSSSGQLIFTLDPAEYVIQPDHFIYDMCGENGNKLSKYSPRVSVARATNARGAGIIVVGMKVDGRVVIALANANGQKQVPELQKLPDTKYLYDSDQYYVGEFDPQNRGDELKIVGERGDGYGLKHIYYYDLASLTLIRKLTVTYGNGSIGGSIEVE